MIDFSRILRKFKVRKEFFFERFEALKFEDFDESVSVHHNFSLPDVGIDLNKKFHVDNFFKTTKISSDEMLNKIFSEQKYSERLKLLFNLLLYCSSSKAIFKNLKFYTEELCKRKYFTLPPPLAALIFHIAT